LGIQVCSFLIRKKQKPPFGVTFVGDYYEKVRISIK